MSIHAVMWSGAVQTLITPVRLTSHVLTEDARVAPVCVDGSENRYYHFDHEEGYPCIYVQEYR
jgi:hypothetical protein